MAYISYPKEGKKIPIYKNNVTCVQDIFNRYYKNPESKKCIDKYEKNEKKLLECIQEKDLSLVLKANFKTIKEPGIAFLTYPLLCKKEKSKIGDKLLQIIAVISLLMFFIFDFLFSRTKAMILGTVSLFLLYYFFVVF
jgi:hypothetical protein